MEASKQPGVHVGKVGSDDSENLQMMNKKNTLLQYVKGWSEGTSRKQKNERRGRQQQQQQQ